jgi:hypothetical protein
MEAAGVGLCDVLLQVYFAVNEQEPPLETLDVDQCGGAPQDHLFSLRTLFSGMDDGAYVREAKEAFDKVEKYCRKAGIDPWANCPFPGASTEGKSPALPNVVEEPSALFLPPPPQEIASQMDRGANSYDAEAELLRSAIQQLQSPARTSDTDAGTDELDP